MSKVCMLCGTTFPDSITFCAKDGSALRAAVQGDSLIGEVFCDRYVVTDLLGEGGMGAVYAASDVRLPQQVAIKVLREQVMSDQTVVARFRQEAEAASRINHDRVARVTDFGFMTDGRAYLIMEYVGGQTLKQMIAERGPVDVAQTSRIVTMVAEGLDAAHRLGIVHRDLKPDNVMILDDAGGGVRLKVLDFGIAKALHGNEDSAGNTKTGFVIGTPQWMSPEQILGESLDARSDVYALGLLAYMMLTGKRAFESSTTEAEMMARLTSSPRALHEIMPSVSWPAGLEALLQRTLSRDVNERPEGALAFARAFAGIAARVGSPASTTSNMRVGDFNTPPVTQSTSTRNERPLALAEDERRQPPALATLTLNEQQPGALNKIVAVTLGLAAVAAIAFFAVRQWPADNGKLTAADNPGSTVAGASANDTVNRGAVAPQITEPPTVLPAERPPAAKPNVEVGERATQSATRTIPPTGATGSANTAPPDSAKVTAPRGAVPGAPAAARPTSAEAAASIELKHLMDLADLDFADKDLYEINARIRRFESLLPELGTPTDKGNAHLYIAMSHNALGDNVKACASLNRAEPMATQSAALRSNVEQWQGLLKCGQ
ncbi:MAG: serine/threonine-protein kinase [Gemmatimonas sp.]